MKYSTMINLQCLVYKPKFLDLQRTRKIQQKHEDRKDHLSDRNDGISKDFQTAIINIFYILKNLRETLDERRYKDIQ